LLGCGDNPRIAIQPLSILVTELSCWRSIRTVRRVAVGYVFLLEKFTNSRNKSSSDYLTATRNPSGWCSYLFSKWRAVCNLPEYPACRSLLHVVGKAALSRRTATPFAVEEAEMDKGNINRMFSSHTPFCSKYEELLLACQRALESWAKRRDEAAQMGLSGKELGDELIRLQAGFARSYALLRKHTHECALCEFASNTINTDSAGPSVFVSHQSQPA
jgi:hypothetical protein